jgi:hypothetical protein
MLMSHELTERQMNIPNGIEAHCGLGTAQSTHTFILEREIGNISAKKASGDSERDLTLISKPVLLHQSQKFLPIFAHFGGFCVWILFCPMSVLCDERRCP